MEILVILPAAVDTQAVDKIIQPAKDAALVFACNH